MYFILFVVHKRNKMEKKIIKIHFCLFLFNHIFQPRGFPQCLRRFVRKKNTLKEIIESLHSKNTIIFPECVHLVCSKQFLLTQINICISVSSLKFPWKNPILLEIARDIIFTFESARVNFNTSRKLFDELIFNCV